MRALLLGFALMLAAFAAAAQEGPIAFATHESGALAELFDVQSVCPPGTKRVLFHAPDKTITPGCWVFHEGRIYMLYEDGDRGDVSAERFTWLRGKPGKPASLRFM